MKSNLLNFPEVKRRDRVDPDSTDAIRMNPGHGSLCFKSSNRYSSELITGKHCRSLSITQGDIVMSD